MGLEKTHQGSTIARVHYCFENFFSSTVSSGKKLQTCKQVVGFSKWFRCKDYDYIDVDVKTMTTGFHFCPWKVAMFHSSSIHVKVFQCVQASLVTLFVLGLQIRLRDFPILISFAAAKFPCITPWSLSSIEFIFMFFHDVSNDICEKIMFFDNHTIPNNIDETPTFHWVKGTKKDSS
jgi:hypothetical protein